MGNYFLQLHHGKTHTEWMVNLRNITAISNDSDGVRIYLVGDSIPVAVDETVSQIKELISNSIQ